MKNDFRKATSFLFPLALIFSVLLIGSCKKYVEEPTAISIAAKDPKVLKDFSQVNLVANNANYGAARVDPLLENAWGIAFSSFGTVWISAQGTGVSTVYNKDGLQALPAVTIPSPGAATGGNPTGQVFHPGRGFRLPTNGNPARFIFVGLDGVISGWNGGPAAARVRVDAGGVLVGAALARNGVDSFLYVADFRENEIDVYDTTWSEVNMSFSDPDLPMGYAPFNVQTIDNKLYVLYAKVGGDGRSDAGPGNGYVNIFNPDGTLVERFISRGQLNAPWGIAKAPASFWGSDCMAGRILVGNFGDGRINVYDADGNSLGQLRQSGNPIVIDGLWGISFAPTTATTINPNWLYFAAGPAHEEDGLFGYITKE